MALKDIKVKIEATKRMHTVTRAMEAVSAVKMRKTQQAAFDGRPYARAALSILARLSGTHDIGRHALSNVREVKKTALVVITSDKGLAGALNSGVVKRAAERAQAGDAIYAYGKKGYEYFSRRGYDVKKYVENKRDDVPLSVMEELARELSDGFMRGEYDEVVVAYSNFQSTFEQSPTLRTLLPLSIENVRALVEDIRPAKGKWSDNTDVAAPASYETESVGNDILDFLVPRLAAVSLYHMLLESKASEHSARMVAMKSASDKSKEVARDLTRVYNKIRQAAITREVSEIVGGREVLAI
ncbi:ATP synthase F1 subunit gamma [Candidatus Parcubacteria bacterium]|nr:ATP synthase F1 subunit gamma [Candidatus Parcubacteria bacterium]